MHTLKAEKGYLLLIGFLTHTDLTKLCEVAPENKDVLSIFLHSFSKYFTEKFLPKWQKKFLNHCIISWLFVRINYICTYCHINSSCTLIIHILSYQFILCIDDTDIVISARLLLWWYLHQFNYTGFTFISVYAMYLENKSNHGKPQFPVFCCLYIYIELLSMTVFFTKIFFYIWMFIYFFYFIFDKKINSKLP